MATRIKAGSQTEVIPNKDKNNKEIVFKLKLKGVIPKLQ